MKSLQRAYKFCWGLHWKEFVEGREALERCPVGGGGWYVALRRHLLFFGHA